MLTQPWCLHLSSVGPHPTAMWLEPSKASVHIKRRKKEKLSTPRDGPQRVPGLTVFQKMMSSARENLLTGDAP